jgi:hypothetical protein
MSVKSEITLNDMRYAENCAKRICRCYRLPYDDQVRSASWTGLAKGFNRYDGSVDFEYWIFYRVRDAVIDYFRTEFGRAESLDNLGARKFSYFNYVDFADVEDYIGRDGLENRVILKDLMFKFVVWLESESQHKYYEHKSEANKKLANYVKENWDEGICVLVPMQGDCDLGLSRKEARHCEYMNQRARAMFRRFWKIQKRKELSNELKRKAS